jgi:hypothetical protein
MAAAAASDSSSFPPDLVARVESELTPGEKLVWLGQPRPSLYARASIFLVIFGVFWLTIVSGIFGAIFIGGGMAAAWAGGQQGLAGLFALIPACFSIPFWAVGIGMVTSPVWMRRYARRVCYAITDRRALIWEPRLFGSIQVYSFAGAGLGAMSRVERRDGSGDLIFQEFRGTNSEGHSTLQQRGFKAIDNVRQVEDLIRRTLLQP